MYTVSVNNIHQILTYSDVYKDEIPDLKNEIAFLNIHKSISIICELIRIRDISLEDIPVIGGNFSLPFEIILKKWFNIKPQSPGDLIKNPLLRKNVHIISVQMLLLLLKKIIQYGDINTINNTDYIITEEDYKKIIQLQLIVAEE